MAPLLLEVQALWSHTEHPSRRCVLCLLPNLISPTHPHPQALPAESPDTLSSRGMCPLLAPPFTLFVGW